MPTDERANILLVDDNPSNLLALEAVLNGMGHRLVKAGSGEEALRRSLEEEFAVILLDVQMPGMDGFETARLLNERERSRDTPLIFMTAFSKREEHMAKAYSLGAADYIFKPIVSEVLKAKVAVFVALFEKTRQIKQQAADLARSNADLEQFAYVASHDLQEPLRMVTSYLQLVAKRYQGKLDADADEFIAYAVDGSERMKELIGALLTFSRVSTHTKPFQQVDCEPILDRVLDDLQVSIAESGAEVVHEPLPTVFADASQVGQLLQNLIGNAIKYRGEKRPRVLVTAERNEEEWVFSVEDNGIGFDPQYADRIFGIFQRLHAKGEYRGTGIGLAVCKRIVERHGGRIWVEPEEGRGATFHFTLPTHTAVEREVVEVARGD